jgi:HlyD family secretion protein
VVERKAVSAPAAGEVTETYYRPGEWVPAGAAVASLLPDNRRKLRFYVPETALAGLKPGQAVEAACDGCAQPIRASIDFIAPQAEYTPPVIYSRGSREKLVFRIEAAPAPEQAASLRPGLPVDVRLLER